MHQHQFQMPRTQAETPSRKHQPQEDKGPRERDTVVRQFNSGRELDCEDIGIDTGYLRSLEKQVQGDKK